MHHKFGSTPSITPEFLTAFVDSLMVAQVTHQQLQLELVSLWCSFLNDQGARMAPVAGAARGAADLGAVFTEMLPRIYTMPVAHPMSTYGSYTACTAWEAIVQRLIGTDTSTPCAHAVAAICQRAAADFANEVSHDPRSQLRYLTLDF